MLAKPKVQQLLFSTSITAEEAIRRILLYKISKNHGFIVTIRPKDVETVLGIKDHGLKTEVGKLLSKYAKMGLLKERKKSRPRSYIVTSRFIKEILGLNYLDIRENPSFTWVHVFFMVLSHLEANLEVMG